MIPPDLSMFHVHVMHQFTGHSESVTNKGRVEQGCLYPSSCSITPQCRSVSQSVEQHQCNPALRSAAGELGSERSVSFELHGHRF